MDYRVGPKTGEEKTTDALVVRSEEERDGEAPPPLSLSLTTDHRSAAVSLRQFGPRRRHRQWSEKRMVVHPCSVPLE